MAKDMPVVSPDDDEEFERRDGVYTRLNPTGDEEQVVDDEATLNELCEELNEEIDFWEGMEFGGPSPAMSPEQQEHQRDHIPQLVRSSGDTDEDSPNNMTGSTPRVSDGPERSRAKSKYMANATARGNDRPGQIRRTRGDGIDYGATHSEDRFDELIDYLEHHGLQEL